MTRKMILNTIITNTKWDKDIHFNWDNKKHYGYIITYCINCKQQQHHNLLSKTNKFCIFECSYCKENR